MNVVIPALLGAIVALLFFINLRLGDIYLKLSGIYSMLNLLFKFRFSGASLEMEDE